MLSFSSRHRFYLFRVATDMRKGFNGLCGLVREHGHLDLMQGDVFMFMNKRRDRIKLLVWDRNGFVVWYKILEQGTFELPHHNSSVKEMPWSDLQMLLEGIEISSIKRRKRYTQAA